MVSLMVLTHPQLSTVGLEGWLALAVQHGVLDSPEWT